MTLPNSPITVRIVGMTDVGLVREHNEDNFLVIDLESGETDFGQGREIAIGARGALLVVCDGMGGAAAGEVASQMAVSVMLREMRPESSEATVPPVQADHEKPTGPTAVVPLPGAKPDPSAESKPAPAAESGAAPATAPAAEPTAPTAIPSSESHPAPAASLDGHAEITPTADLPISEPAKPVIPAPVASAAKPEASPAATEEPLASPAPALTPGATPIAAPVAAATPAVPTAPADAVAKEPVASSSSSTKFEIAEPELHGLARKLRVAVTKSNQEIYEAACADIAKAGMGTTATSMLLLRSHVIVAQVGDSRAYMWRKGKLTQITHDQSLVNQLLDSGQITAEQAKLFEHSNVILQALGVQEDVEVVLSTEVLRRSDRLLLCSDGLVGVVADEEIQDVLTHTENLADAARRLIELARAGGGPDNITVIVGQITNDAVPPPAADEEVLYRPLYLDGEKPADRRIWAPEYGMIGQPMGGRDSNSGPGQSTQVSQRMSVIAMSAVLALLIAGIVGGVLYHKQPVSPALPGLPVAPTSATNLPPPVLPPMPTAAQSDGATAPVPPAPAAAAAADAGAESAAATPLPPVAAPELKPVAPAVPSVSPPASGNPIPNSPTATPDGSTGDGAEAPKKHHHRKHPPGETPATAPPDTTVTPPATTPDKPAGETPPAPEQPNADKPVDKPADKPVDKPAEAPADKPIDKPADTAPTP